MQKPQFISGGLGFICFGWSVYINYVTFSYMKNLSIPSFICVLNHFIIGSIVHGYVFQILGCNPILSLFFFFFFPQTSPAQATGNSFRRFLSPSDRSASFPVCICVFSTFLFSDAIRCRRFILFPDIKSALSPRSFGSCY